MAISTAERKKRVSELRETHEDYFQTEGKINALYIPKMAYRPSGKDELHVSYFPSELEKEEDIYTEFVSIDYVAEDSKRTLYLVKHNPHWKSKKIPGVGNVKLIGHVSDLFNIADPEATPSSDIVNKLEEINQTLITLTKVINKFNK